MSARKRNSGVPLRGPKGKVVIVSNRLPFRVERVDDEVQIKAGSGGLVTALAPVLRDRHGVWVGWDGDVFGGAPAAVLEDHSASAGYQLVPLALDSEEVKEYYWGFSNATLWPLFHDMLDQCHFVHQQWEAYKRVNRKFADRTAAMADDDDLIWIHDYQLILAGEYLHHAGIRARKAYFLHIPFPPWDLFVRLPWREEILRAFLFYDVVGLQTERDRRNFVQCVRRLFPAVRTERRGRFSILHLDDRRVSVASFPISIDFREFVRVARSKEVEEKAWLIHENLPERKLILGVDRLDYTKGIPQRLEAFEFFLEKYPEMRGRVTLVQVLVPSRVRIQEYQEMKDNIERMIGRINGRFTTHGWIPITYMAYHLDRPELVGYYRTSEIALITPLKDGMNLIAKEYCASCVNGDGVLILSEFAGAASQLGKSALLVNPYHVEAVADRIYQAYHMPREERVQRMQRMRAQIRSKDVFYWVAEFFKAQGVGDRGTRDFDGGPGFERR
jgi:trehalose 6-phosphate synthase/phosphatase